jgi:hypothetical protein
MIRPKPEEVTTFEFGKRKKTKNVFAIMTHIGLKEISRDEALGKYFWQCKIVPEDEIRDFSK